MKLQSILSDKSGIGSSRATSIGTGLNNYNCATILRLNEELTMKMKNSIRNMRKGFQNQSSTSSL